MYNGPVQLSFVGPGGPEILLIMLVLLLLFGSKDAPRIMRKLSDMWNQIRNTADNFRREVMYSDLSDGPMTDHEFEKYDEFGVDTDDETDSGDVPETDEKEEASETDDDGADHVPKA